MEVHLDFVIFLPFFVVFVSFVLGSPYGELRLGRVSSLSP